MHNNNNILMGMVWVELVKNYMKLCNKMAEDNKSVVPIDASSAPTGS